MSLGEYTGAGSGTTKLLLHLNGNNTDTSGNSNSSTDTAITYSQANGKFGQGAGFNGSSSIILITDNAALQGTGSHTIGLWVKFTALPASDANVWLIMKGYDDGITGGWGVGLNLFDTSGTAKFRSYCASSADASHLLLVFGILLCQFLIALHQKFSFMLMVILYQKLLLLII